MCLITFAWKRHPRYPLVVAANRDEFTDRPTDPADFWPEAPTLLAGRDRVGGGTWLGVTRCGRFAAVTNYRDPSLRRPGSPSRGALVRDFLLGVESPEAYLARVLRQGDAYAGFNLLVGERDALFYLSNVEGKVRALEPGIYALSNGLLDASWPKAQRARTALAAALEDPEGPDPEALFAFLADTSRPEDAALPDTGVGLEWERTLSSVFIAALGYGTRSSTVLRLSAEGEADFRERTFAPSAPAGERAFRFALRPPQASGQG